MRGVSLPARRVFAEEVAVEGHDEVDPEAVIPTLVKLERVLGVTLKTPRLVVVGNQSAGKSSVLEAIVGTHFLPTGNKMVTTRPLHLSLIRSQTGIWAEFDDGRKIFDFKVVQELLREKNDGDVTEDPIALTIYSPEVHNVNLVDLPGYVHALRKGQDADLPHRIAKLCDGYVRDPENIIVAVASAAEDIAVSMGVKEAQQSEESLARSIGVLTKMDLLKSRKHIVSILRNEDYPLGMGYVGVRCRTRKEYESGKTFKDVLKIEEKFIKRSRLRSYDGDLRLGIPTLRRILSEEQLRRSASSFPHILQLLDEKIEDAAKDEQFLLAIAGEKDLKNVARELERLVNKFHPTSPDRLEFEASVRDLIGDAVHQTWFDAMDDSFAFTDPPSPLASPNLSARLTDGYKASSHEEKVQRAAKSLLSQTGFAPDSHFVESRDRMERALVFGAGGTPDKFDDASLASLATSTASDGALAPFYKYVFPENTNRARPAWQEGLENTVETVLEEGDLVGACRTLTVDSLLKFVDSAAEAGTKRESILALHFFRYLVKKIASEINSDGLSSNIQGMIRREKRAVVSYPALASETAELLRSPEPSSGLASWAQGVLGTSSHKWPLVLPIYGQVFTQAYMGAVVDRVSNDIFRSLAVELLNPMILEAIFFSLNMFKSGRLRRAAKKQLEYVQELKGYRRTILSAQARYGPKPDNE